ncbi:MAG: beta-lactamase family protein [Anaerolineae bacterium]|nr:beta-lactamase family protein [Anaerolineae bacterium]
MSRKSFTLFALLLMTILTIVACGQADTPETAPTNLPRPTAAQTSYKEATVDDSSADLSPDALDDFVDFVEENRQAYEIPGLAVAVVRGNEIVLAQGFGVKDIRGDDPVTPETLFHIGSTNKSVTAMLIATLVDDGLFDWDTPVVEIVPEFELSDAESTQQATIRHLLSMSSGIPDDAEDDFDLEDADAADVFDLVAEAELLGPPGEVFSYSNPSNAISGYIGVLADGGDFDNLYEGYAEQLQRRIFDPIGMESATLSVEEAHANPNMSASHIFEDGEVVVAESYDFTGDPLAPSGSIKASVVDMARYMITQVNRGVAPDGTRVVSAANLTETWQPAIDTGENTDYAMGWEVGRNEEADVIWHEGAYDSFTSILVFMPATKSGLVVLTNLDDPDDFLEVMRNEFTKLITSG